MTFWIRVTSILLMIGLAGSLAEAREKTDVIIMKNGDKFVGEIKKLDEGVLYLGADYTAEDMQLDWLKVDRIDTTNEFIVTLANGTRDTGAIHKIPEPDGNTKGFTIVSNGATTTNVRNYEIIRIAQAEHTVWAQLVGSLNGGVTYTGGTSATQLNFSGDAAYRTERWGTKVTGSTVFNRQEGAEDSGRNNMNLSFYRYGWQRWFLMGIVGLLNSQQQDLALRETVGGGVGADLVQRARTQLRALAGVLFLHEQYSPASGSLSQRGADSQFLLQFSTNRFTKFQFDVDAGAFPSLTDFGRVRMSLDSSLKREIARNFNVRFSIYENYDSRPPVTAPKNDFGTSMTVGWTF